MANNQDFNASISTSIIGFWDVNGVQLRIQAMENGLVLGFWLPSFDGNGSRKYPKEIRHNAVISAEKLTAFEKAIKDVVVDAYAQGKNGSVAIFTNMARTTIIEVACIEGKFYVFMHKDCDPSTRKAGATITVEFRSENVMDAYDPKTGTATGYDVQADFYLFLKTIECYNEEIGGMVAGHGARVALSGFTKEVLKRIGGGNSTYNTGYNSNYNGGNSSNSYVSYEQAGKATAPAATAATSTASSADFIESLENDISAML